jgi:AraC-like DNA-binding protein
LFIGEFPGADRAAATFDMPERSFRRRLGDAGRSYQKILDGVRLEKARGYLADSSRSVEEIAGLLGYSEPAAFIRAFERWTGQTPSRYRKTL